MLRNPFKVLQELVARPGALVGVVTAVSNGQVTVELPDGGLIMARGDATVGQVVYVRDGAVEGTAPSLPIVTIDV